MKIGFEFIKKILNQMESGQKKPKGEVSFSSLMKDKKAKNKKIVALNANLKKESKALKAKCSHSALDRMVQSSEGKKAVKEPKKGLEGKKIGETKKSLKKLDKDLTNVSNLESPKKLMDLEKSINKENKLSTLKSIKTEETAAGIQEINKEKLEKKKKQKEQHLFLLADVVPFNSQVASEPKALQKKELESNKKPGLILIERPEVIQIKEQKKDQLSQLKKNAAEALLNSKNQKSNSSKKTKAITKNGDLKSAAEKESIKLNKQQKTAGNSEIKVPDAVSALQSQSSADKVLELPKSSSPLNQDKSISVGEWSSLMAGEGQELLDKKSQNKKGTQNGSFSGEALADQAVDTTVEFKGEVFRGSNLRQLEKKVGELLQKMKGKVLALATDQISLSLEPANLGKMLISSEKKNEVVKVSLQFENPQTLEEAKKDMSVLKEHLENSFGGNIELDMGSLSDGQLSSFNDSENNPNDSLAQGLLNKQIEIENQEKTPSHKKAEDAWVDLIV